MLQETPPHRVVVDFTRGTKAMSAALVLAATRREVPHLRYVTGPRDRRGMVQAGSEEVRQIRTTVAAGHRRLDLARDLMLRGNFPAAEAVLPDPEHRFAAIFPHDLLRVAGRGPDGGSVLCSLGSTRLRRCFQRRDRRDSRR